MSYFGFAQRITQFLLFLFVISVSLFAIPKTYAAENFATDYNIIYVVTEDATTHAVMNISLTNLTSNYIAASYKVQLGFPNVVNLQVSDSGGKIIPAVTKNENGQLIEFKFNSKVVGLGNKQSFRVTFDTPDIAQKQGTVWEINIPGIADQQDFNSFDVQLQVPKSFGEPAYIKPNQEHKTLRFTKEQLGKSGISIAFGEKQVYDFSLVYHLANKNLFPIRTEIALPPGTNYQDVFIHEMTPEPVQVTQDTDGNWLAEYELMPSKRLEVTVKGSAVLYLRPKKTPMSEKDLQPYLEEKPYWQTSDKKITSLANELRTPEAIYNYVIKTLSYDFSRVTSGQTRIGAVDALRASDSAVCLEFTDLFIAIARAAGIPAREIDGYAYTENPRQRPLSLVEDVLHAWPEYYDREEEAWIMIDPTWGNTTGGVDYFQTLDFDHFAFVKKGISSTYPIPAGGYKNEGDEEKKDITISFAKNDPVVASKIVMNTVTDDSFIAGIPMNGKVRIKNTGPAVSKKYVLTVASGQLEPKEKKYTVDQLLPFEQKEVAFQFDKQPFLTNATHTITMRLAEIHCKSDNGCVASTINKPIVIKPVFVQQWKLLGGIGIGILAIFILIITIKTGRVRVS